MTKTDSMAIVVLAVSLLLAGCETTPAAKTDTARPPSAAPGATTPIHPQQAAPEAENEGMTVYELQDRLSALGYKLVSVDGVLGPRTVEALKKFQSDKNLAVTGTINVETVRALRSAKP